MSEHTNNTYQWKGHDAQGNDCKGQMVAMSPAMVRVQLKQQGIVARSVKVQPKALYEFQGKIKRQHIVSFSRQLTTLLKAGMPLAQSLQLMKEGMQKPLALKSMLDSIHNSVENGTPLSQALSQYPLLFDELYISLIRAGEASGRLDEMLNKIATNMEKTERIKRKVKKAMTYPLTVLVVAIVVTIVLLVKVIPVFEVFFADFGAELPALTQTVISISQSLRGGAIVIPVTLIALIMLLLWLKKRHSSLRKKINQWAFAIPIIGVVFKLGAMARFARTLSVLFEAGVPLIDSLQATAPATGSVIYENATYRIAKAVENGTPLSQAMQQGDNFEQTAIQLVKVGEEAGNLGEMLGYVATMYEEQLDDKVTYLTTMLEPLIISLLALIIGTLVIALYLPIFLLGDIVS